MPKRTVAIVANSRKKDDAPTNVTGLTVLQQT